MSTATDPLPLQRAVAGTHPFAPLLARLRAHSLDRRLARGIEPWRTPVLAARARQLTSERSRRSLARSLERLVRQAQEPPRHSRSVVVRPSRSRVREARPLLLMLAARLRSGDPVDVRGAAAIKHLLTGGDSPLYAPGDPEMLARALQRITSSLDMRLC
jgi:hypothetical protein